MVDCFKFLGTMISSDLGWVNNIYVAVKTSTKAVIPAPTKEVRADDG